MVSNSFAISAFERRCPRCRKVGRSLGTITMDGERIHCKNCGCVFLRDMVWKIPKTSRTEEEQRRMAEFPYHLLLPREA